MIRLNRILCPVDFSDPSRRAVDHAIGLARRHEASIVGLHAANQALRHLPDMSPLEEPLPENELKRLRDETRATFARATAAGIPVDIRVDIGRADKAIVQAAGLVSADLIVMGTHGHSGFDRLFLGSITEKVLRQAPCPVLTVPPHARNASPLPYKRLLCAVDFSDWSMAALDLASSLAKASSGALTLLHVIEWPWVEPQPPHLDELPDSQAAALAEYRRYVETSARDRLETLVRERCPARGRVTHGKSHREILGVAAEIDADLIVMGVHSRNVADLIMFGSTTNQVVRHAECPVLTVRR